MAKFIVEPEFWELFPEGQVNVLVLKGINNTVDETEDPYFEGILKEACQKAQVHFTEEVFSDNLVIQQWRQAYSKFKTKKGARSSIEALLKRVSQGHTFRLITPLVDIYNSISIEYAVPLGGEDLDKIQGDLRLGKAKGGESFFPLGAEEDSPALEGEICHFDNDGAVCRCLNWREAQRTMLQEETTNAVLVMESVTKDQAERANVAMEALKKRCEEYFNVTGVSSIVTPENSEVEL